MNKDIKYISKLYESIAKIDYFNQNIDKKHFDWDYFFYEALNKSYILIESFEILSRETTPNGKTDVYKITTLKGNEYILNIDYQNSKKLGMFIFAGLRENSEPSKEYFNKLKGIIGNDGEMCFIRFEDIQGRNKLTGKEGLGAVEVFSGLKLAITDSFAEHIKDTNLKGIVMLISKGEEFSRLPLYKKLIEKYLLEFTNIYVDRTSDKLFTHLIATK